jgi:hypothetical protein
MLRFLCALSLLWSLTAWADTDRRTAKGGLYVGLKGLYNDLAPEGTDNAGGVALLVADHYNNGFGVEAEVSRSEADIHLLDLNEDYTLDTAGLYGVYRSPGVWYVKARAGLLWKRLTVAGESSSKTAFGGGLGGGYDFGRLLIEGEYTYIDQDITQFSVAIIGKF